MRWLTFALVLCASSAAAVVCEDIDYRGDSYTACTVDAAAEDLRLFHTDQDGAILGGFRAVAAALGDGTLAFCDERWNVPPRPCACRVLP